MNEHYHDAIIAGIRHLPCVKRRADTRKSFIVNDMKIIVFHIEKRQ